MNLFSMIDRKQKIRLSSKPDFSDAENCLQFKKAVRKEILTAGDSLIDFVKECLDMSQIIRCFIIDTMSVAFIDKAIAMQLFDKIV